MSRNQLTTLMSCAIYILVGVYAMVSAIRCRRYEQQDIWAPHAIRDSATCTRTPWATNDMYNLHTIKLVACARDIYSHKIMDTATLLWLPTHHNTYARTVETVRTCVRAAASTKLYSVDRRMANLSIISVKHWNTIRVAHSYVDEKCHCRGDEVVIVVKKEVVARHI